MLERYVQGSLTQGNTLADTDDDTTGNENSKGMLRGKCLHESCNDGQESSSGHSHPSPKAISLSQRISKVKDRL